MDIILQRSISLEKSFSIEMIETKDWWDDFPELERDLEDNFS